MSKLLINENPIAFLPSLACLDGVGVDGALMLQQVHYWITNPKIGEIADGRRWVRNSLNEWRRDNFPFWSKSKISRIGTKLEKNGFLVSRDDLNKHGYDRTKWYTIDYGKLQNCKMQFADLQHAACSSGTTIPETTREKEEERGAGEKKTAGDVFTAYENEIGALTQIVSDDVGGAIDEYGTNWVYQAIETAARHNARNWAYAAACLKNWQANGRGAGRNGQAGNGRSPSKNGDGAETAWGVVERAMKDGGRILKDHPDVLAVINDMEGWPRFRTATDRDWPWLKKEFIKRYKEKQS